MRLRVMDKSRIKTETQQVIEDVLEKLKCNIRSIIAHSTENSKDLLDLCIDVIYHEKMKAFGLKNLILAFLEWEANRPSLPAEEA